MLSNLGGTADIDFVSVPVMFAGADFFVPEGFASAEATKGLSDRPLETFGCLLLRLLGGWNWIG